LVIVIAHEYYVCMSKIERSRSREREIERKRERVHKREIERLRERERERERERQTQRGREICGVIINLGNVLQFTHAHAFLGLWFLGDNDNLP